MFLEVLVLSKLFTQAESQKQRLCTKYISDAFPRSTSIFTGRGNLAFSNALEYRLLVGVK